MLAHDAGPGGQFGGETGLGPGGDHADRAHRRRGSEQGRLRSLDDLDPLHIVDVLIGATRAGNVDAVIIKGDARRLLGRSAVRRDAANDDARIVGALFLDVEAGDIVGQFVQVGNADFRHPLAADGRYGDGHVHRPLFDLLRGHDDLLAACCLDFGRHGLGRSWEGGAAGKQGDEKLHTACHVGEPLF